MPFDTATGVGQGFVASEANNKYFILEKSENYYGYYYLTYIDNYTKYYLHYVNTLGDGDIVDPTGATNKSYLQFFNSTISNPTEATGKYITTSALWKFTFGGANSRLNSDGATISYIDDKDISLGSWLLLDSNFDYLPQ